MKAFYNLVTFLAAVVVLGWAGWCTYTHWDVLVKQPTTLRCKCCMNCVCGKKDCKGGCCGKKCCNDCGCTEAGCCKN